MLQGKEVILVGDFNVALTVNDVHPTISLEDTFPEVERNAVRKFMEKKLCVDVWRQLHPKEHEVFTCWDQWRNARAFNRGVRIDYVFVTQGLINRVSRCDVVDPLRVPHAWSDHAPLLLDIDLPPSKDVGRKSTAAWEKLQDRFIDRNQRSIMSMFSRKRKKEDETT